MTVAVTRLFDPVQVANSTTTYYTCPSKTTVILRRLVACNTDSSARTLTVYMVENGGSAGNSNMAIDAENLTVNQTWVAAELEGLVLTAGDTIQMVASSASAITVHASGTVIT